MGGAQAEHSEEATLVLLRSHRQARGHSSAAKCPVAMGTLPARSYLWSLALPGAEYGGETSPERAKIELLFFIQSCSLAPRDLWVAVLDLIRIYIKASDRKQEAFRAPHRPLLEQLPPLPSFFLSQMVLGVCKVPSTVTWLFTIFSHLQ